MGIIVSEEYTNVNGFVTPGLYVNIDNIQIFKSSLETCNYDVEADRCVYISKEARVDNKEPIEKIRVFIAIDNMDNLHEQIYTEVKKVYPNYTDDL
jgi:hypothetical protein|tara:strand:+ start:763 stop:1050 length:288 start_codon:yes stop_codon:yes gene_type:complete